MWAKACPHSTTARATNDASPTSNPSPNLRFGWRRNPTQVTTPQTPASKTRTVGLTVTAVPEILIRTIVVPSTARESSLHLIGAPSYFTASSERFGVIRSDWF